MKHYLLISLFALSLCCCAEKKPEDRQFVYVTAENRTFAIPDSINFCGQHIDLTRYDMRERFDREQLAFAYGHANTIRLFKLANTYFPIIEPILKQYGVPDDMKYLCVIESYLSPTIKSPAGAVGLWQFMPATGKQYGLEINDEVDERCNVAKSTEAACKYLMAAYQKYGDWPSAAASYNAGQGKISKELERQQAKTSLDLALVSETSRYVFRIMAMKHLMEHPQDYGFCLHEEDFYHTIPTEEVKVTGPVSDWINWAIQHNITYSTLLDFNPWIKQSTLSNKSGKTYIVLVPKKDDLNCRLNKIKIHNPAWVKK